MDITVDLSNTRLETERMILRPWSVDDLADFYEYASVPGVGEMAGWGHHVSLNISKAVLDSFIAEKCIFALELRENSKVIGSFGFHNSWANEMPEYKALFVKEVGYVLSKDYWGRGLMPEVLKSVISFAFDELHLDALTVGHFVENKQSRRVIEKCGFTYVKSGIYDAKLLGKEIEEMSYILLRKDFEKTNA